MSSHSKAESGDGKTPEITVWDGNADGYLDAVDAYARYTRKSYRGGIAEWIWGEQCPIHDGMSAAEIDAACRAIGKSLQQTNAKYAAFLWESNGL